MGKLQEQVRHLQEKLAEVECSHRQQLESKNQMMMLIQKVTTQLMLNTARDAKVKTRSEAVEHASDRTKNLGCSRSKDQESDSSGSSFRRQRGIRARRGESIKKARPNKSYTKETNGDISSDESGYSSSIISTVGREDIVKTQGAAGQELIRVNTFSKITTENTTYRRIDNRVVIHIGSNTTQHIGAKQQSADILQQKADYLKTDNSNQAAVNKNQIECRNQNIDTNPQNTDTRHQNSDTRPQNTDTRQQHTDTRHQNTDTRHQNTDTRPQNTDTRPHNTDTRNQLTDTRHQNTDTRPQNTDTRHQNTDTRHQSHNNTQTPKNVKSSPSKHNKKIVADINGRVTIN